MKRLWAYDDIIKKGLKYARKHGLDLGADLEEVDPRHFETYHVIPPPDMVAAIQRARKSGLEWPEKMPVPIVVCSGHQCVILDGHHRIEAAKQLKLSSIPAIVGSLETWERLLPVIETPDVIPYEDMIAILAEAGSPLIRKNLEVEAKRAEEGEETSVDAEGQLRWGRRAAGILFERDHGKILLVLRSQEVLDPGMWGIPGGRVEGGEEPGKAADLEAEEEMGPLPGYQVVDRNIYRSGDFEYTTIRAKMKEKDAKNWKPTLNWENDEWGWFSPDHLPEPMHPNVKKVIEAWF